MFEWIKQQLIRTKFNNKKNTICGEHKHASLFMEHRKNVVDISLSVHIKAST